MRGEGAPGSAPHLSRERLVASAALLQPLGVFFQCGAVLVSEGSEAELWRLAEALAEALRVAGVSLPNPPEAMVDEPSGTVWLLLPSLAPNLDGADTAPFRSVMEEWAPRVHLAGAFVSSDDEGDWLMRFGTDAPQRVGGEGFQLIDELGASPLYDDLTPRQLAFLGRPSPSGLVRLAGLQVPTLYGPVFDVRSYCDRLEEHVDGGAWLMRCLGPRPSSRGDARRCFLVERRADGRGGDVRAPDLAWVDARWSRSGRTVLALGASGLEELEWPSLEPVEAWSVALPQHEPAQLALAPSGEQAAVLLADCRSGWGTAFVVSLADRTTTRLVVSLPPPLHDLCFLEDGTLVFEVGNATRVRCDEPGCEALHGVAQLGRISPKEVRMTDLPLRVPLRGSAFVEAELTAERVAATLLPVRDALLVNIAPWDPVLVSAPLGAGQRQDPKPTHA